ncbi:MAG TPA: RimK/LysX family protein [Taishania sp.]|nr:RimK/LysX family protein [Taishania sp.]
MSKITIGRQEKANLPTFGLTNKVVKIDSGAFTSSIDIISIEEVDSNLLVVFEKDGPAIKFENFTRKSIKSSNGITQLRYVIEGEIQLGDKIYKTPFSLTDRSGMKYPILLGRKLLNKNFIIDTSKKNLIKLKEEF